MAGLQKYNKREIVFVMYRMINKVKNEDIVKQFHSEFGRQEFDETQVRYMSNKYGDDVKYGSLKKNFSGAVAGECPLKYVEMAIARGSKTRPSAKKQRTSTRNSIAALYAKAIPKVRRLKETQQARKTSTLNSISLSSPATQSSPKTAPAEKDLGPAIVDTMHTKPLEDASVQFQYLPNPMLNAPAIPLEPMPYLDFDAVPTFRDPLADLNKAPLSYQQQNTFLEPCQFSVVDTDQLVVPDPIEHFSRAWVSPTLHEDHQPIPQLPTNYQPLLPQNSVSYHHKDDDGFFAMPQPDLVGLANPGLSWAQPDYLGDDFEFGMGVQSHDGPYLSVTQ
ncbi:uncharacterized protein J7T54_004269 [Emericellopsis cladophorae]|uniref:Uncharacterized protein n=1 Tax=Emericellopsis cladophorae TaxID=2686198 RepID=A0A9Q0BET0_9HYPO|nr:uncharacterized protein J7T54_004269 [Emericellopsis cladophorae]KAI6783242.1 hypothetical protein J7T54_004269 [Emericellopsis cladophorae]